MNVPRTKQPSQKSYLERIIFDPKLKTGFVASFLTNLRVIVLLVISILGIGLVSYFNLPRRLNPEIKIPIVSVVTLLPGASPEDVESLVTIPLETELQGLESLDTLTSISRENVSAITIQFLSSVDADKAKDQVQTAVDQVTDLPSDAQTSNVRAFDFEDQPIWTFALLGQDTASLMRFAQNLKTDIEELPKVDRVTLQGFEEQEIAVTINPQKIHDWAVNPLTLSSLIKSSLLSFPAGTLDTNANTFSLTVDPAVLNVDDLRALRLSLRGSVVALGDIADIAERTQADQPTSFVAADDVSPRRAVTFNVFKTKSANIDESERAVKELVTNELAAMSENFKLTTIINTADEVNTQFFDLLGEFRSTILLVMTCLFIFLGLRQALISLLTVPLTFLSAFIFMRIFGMSINFLSLFAFLLALGLLVDDTIVVVSAMTTYFKTGKFTPWETALLVWRDTIVPIWSTTITTIWSFAPLLLSTGIIGEFIKPIPVVVSVTMISSTAIATLITLPFMAVILKPHIPYRVIILTKLVSLFTFFGLFIYLLRLNPLLPLITVVYFFTVFITVQIRKPLKQKILSPVKKQPRLAVFWERIVKYSNHGVLDISVLSKKYYRLIERILSSERARKQVIIGIILYALLSFALLPLGFVKNEFFPKTDEDTIYAGLELPPGTNIKTTENEALKVLEVLRHTPESEFVSLDTGVARSDFGGDSATTNTALFTLHLQKKADRTMTSSDIAEELRKKFKVYPQGKVTISEVSGGPPAGADIQIKLLGDDLTQLNTFADRIVKYLESQPGLTNVDKSIKPSTSSIIFMPDAQSLAQNGVTREVVGLWLRTYASGFTLASTNFDKSVRTKKDVVFKFDTDQESPQTLGTLGIPTSTGDIPLLSLGALVTKPNPTTITREEGKRTLGVTAGVLSGYSVTTKNKELEDFADSLKLPTGYSWKTGGVNEENQKSVQSILQAMGVSFLLILVTMVVQFRSYRQAVIVLLVIPLAVSSVFLAFALTGTPLSFPALIGVMSLFGIVVTNSMFIVDKININLKQGMPFKEAIADAGESRLEPILLTKLATVLGLLPITLASPLWRGLGGAIISGLLVSSTIMLLFIPVIYYNWFSGEQIGTGKG